MDVLYSLCTQKPAAAAAGRAYLLFRQDNPLQGGQSRRISALPHTVCVCSQALGQFAGSLKGNAGMVFVDVLHATLGTIFSSRLIHESHLPPLVKAGCARRSVDGESFLDGHIAFQRQHRRQRGYLRSEGACHIIDAARAGEGLDSIFVLQNGGPDFTVLKPFRR